MKLILKQAMGYTLEDISKKYFYKCKTLGDFIKSTECAFLNIRYNDDNDNIERFKIYDGTMLNQSEKDKFFKHKDLSHIDLFDDFYNIEISIDMFERDIFVDITENLSMIDAWVEFLNNSLDV